jgi:hypothetical protein
MGEILWNAVRVNSVYSKLEFFSEQLQMNVWICVIILTKSLSIQSLTELDQFSKIMKMWCERLKFVVIRIGREGLVSALSCFLLF